MVAGDRRDALDQLVVEQRRVQDGPRGLVGLEPAHHPAQRAVEDATALAGRGLLLGPGQVVEAGRVEPDRVEPPAEHVGVLGLFHREHRQVHRVLEPSEVGHALE